MWTVSEKQRLIDSVLRGYPLPLFLLAENLPRTGKLANIETLAIDV